MTAPVADDAVELADEGAADVAAEVAADVAGAGAAEVADGPAADEVPAAVADEFADDLLLLEQPATTSATVAAMATSPRRRGE